MFLCKLCCKRWRGNYDFDQSTILFTGGKNRNDTAYRFSNVQAPGNQRGAEYLRSTSVGEPRVPVRRYGPPRIRPRSYERDREYLFDSPLEVIEEPDTIPEEELLKELHVESVDFRKEDNSKRHRTDLYECSERREYEGEVLEAELVVRRGDEFLITIELDRPYDQTKHDMKILFKTGERPLPSKGTFYLCTVQEERGCFSDYDGQGWGVRMLTQVDSCMTVAVYAPPNCPIGEWEIIIKTTVRDDTGKEAAIWYYDCPEDVIILLNPWCKNDAVYIDDEELLNEYILNDSGVCYQGSRHQISGKPWYYGQFDNVILETALFLLRKGLMFRSSMSMGEPVKIARALSRIVNNNDKDMGVIREGSDGNYEDGRSPSFWSGSVKILRQYMEDPNIPVKYGKCWVYANLFTTVCRAVGLPCRSVTCYSAAQTSSFSLAVEKFFTEDESGDPAIPNSWLTSDSVWNFHVWNEVWMSRPDLVSKHYDGWQVIDTTPHERGEGVNRLGPAPVVAVKSGDVDIDYDTAFVFSTINANIIYWKQTITGELSLIRKITDEVGLEISTHKPTGQPYSGQESVTPGVEADLERDVITNNYKHEEGSSEAKAAVAKAIKLSNVTVKQHSPEQNEELDIKLQKSDDVIIGSSVTFSFLVKNKTSVTKTVRTVLMVTPTWYDGILRDSVHKYRFDDVDVEPQEEKMFTSHLDETEAFEKIGGSAVKVTAYARISGETTETVEDECDFQFLIPSLEFTGPCHCQLNDVISVNVSLKNHLQRPLTGCIMDIEGNLECTLPKTDFMAIPDISAGDSFEVVISLRARNSQDRKTVLGFCASFYCNELPVIDGKYSVVLTS